MTTISVPHSSLCFSPHMSKMYTLTKYIWIKGVFFKSLLQGCGRATQEKHALKHYETPRSSQHNVVINTTSWSAWWVQVFSWNCWNNLSRNMTKPAKWLCAQRRLRSAWASAQSDQSLRCPPEESLGPKLPIERTTKTLIRLGGCPGWSESSLGAHSLCWFCHVGLFCQISLFIHSILSAPVACSVASSIQAINIKKS